MDSFSSPYHVIEINEDTSFDAVRRFRHFKGFDWSKAVVDRYDGLTLFAAEEPVAIHFRTALCGYKGSGPAATIEILEAAGFGSPEELGHQINSSVHVTLEM